MSKQKYAYMQAILPEIEKMLAEGKSHKQVSFLLENATKKMKNVTMTGIQYGAVLC